MNKSEREKAINLDAIRRMKRARRRRKLLLIGVGVLALVGAVVWLLAAQFGHVLDDDRDFWGNFNTSQSISANSSQ